MWKVVMMWTVLVGSWVVDGRSVVDVVGPAMVTAVWLSTGDTSDPFRLSVMFPEKVTFSTGAGEFATVPSVEPV